MTNYSDYLNNAVATMGARNALLRKDKEIVNALQRLSSTGSFERAKDTSDFGEALADIRGRITNYLALVDKAHRDKHIDKDALNTYNARAPYMWAWLTALENRLMLSMFLGVAEKVQASQD